MTPEWAEVFTESYKPKKYYLRQSQFDELTSHSDSPVILPFYCEGKSGTGKTLMAKILIDWCKEHNILPIYFNVNRDYRNAILQSFLLQGVKPKFRESFSDLFNRVPQKHIWLLVDDLGEAPPAFRRFLYFLYNETKKLSRVIFFSTSSLEEFYRKILTKPDDRSRYDMKLVVFPPYTAKEFEAIFNFRLQEAEFSFEQDSTKFFAQKCAELELTGHEITRTALKTLQRACEYVSVRKLPEITHSIIQESFDEIKKDYWQERLSNIGNIHTKLLFASATLEALEQPNSNQFLNPLISSHQIYLHYQKFCGKLKIFPLYYERCNYLMGQLIERGFFKKMGTSKLERGKGRTGVYEYCLNPRTIMDSIETVGGVQGWIQEGI